jgi:hypothetical protein
VDIAHVKGRILTFHKEIKNEEYNSEPWDNYQEEPTKAIHTTISSIQVDKKSYEEENMPCTHHQEYVEE